MVETGKGKGGEELVLLGAWLERDCSFSISFNLGPCSEWMDSSLNTYLAYCFT